MERHWQSNQQVEHIVREANPPEKLQKPSTKQDVFTDKGERI